MASEQVNQTEMLIHDMLEFLYMSSEYDNLEATKNKGDEQQQILKQKKKLNSNKDDEPNLEEDNEVHAEYEETTTGFKINDSEGDKSLVYEKLMEYYTSDNPFYNNINYDDYNIEMKLNLMENNMSSYEREQQQFAIWNTQETDSSQGNKIIIESNLENDLKDCSLSYMSSNFDSDDDIECADSDIDRNTSGSLSGIGDIDVDRDSSRSNSFCDMNSNVANDKDFKIKTHDSVRRNNRLPWPSLNHSPNTTSEQINVNGNYINFNINNNCGNGGNIYVQEVRKAFYGDATGYPINDSPEYYEVAENYAIYGSNFLDFPDNWQQLLLNNTTVLGTTISADMSPTRCLLNRNVKYMCNGHSLSNSPPNIKINRSNKINIDLGSNNTVDFNNYITNSTVSNGLNTVINPQMGSAVAVAAAASAATHYHVCNSLQASPRPTLSSKAVAAAAAAYGMFLSNKVSYGMAPPSAQHLVYRQHNVHNAFNAAPTILHSNPILPTTTQQYLNTFFKETQLLNTVTGGVSTNTVNNSTVPNNIQSNLIYSGVPTTIYERLIYAQMVQQHVYHQTNQQAAAIAVLIQQKKRATAAAAAAAAAAATAVKVAVANTNAAKNTVNNNTTHNNNSSNKNSVMHNATSAGTAAINVCNRQAPSMGFTNVNSKSTIHNNNNNNSSKNSNNNTNNGLDIINKCNKNSPDKLIINPTNNDSPIEPTCSNGNEDSSSILKD